MTLRQAFVIPAKAATHDSARTPLLRSHAQWTPAFAGATNL